MMTLGAFAKATLVLILLGYSKKLISIYTKAKSHQKSDFLSSLNSKITNKIPAIRMSIMPSDKIAIFRVVPLLCNSKSNN